MARTVGRTGIAALHEMSFLRRSPFMKDCCDSSSRGIAHCAGVRHAACNAGKWRCQRSAVTVGWRLESNALAHTESLPHGNRRGR